MYASCSSIRNVQLVFDNMSQQDVVLWNVILMAFFSNKECEKGLALFYHMRNDGVELNDASWSAVIGGCVQNRQSEQALQMLGKTLYLGFKPNQIMITSVLLVCTSLESLRMVKEIHGYIYKNLFIKDLATTTALVFIC